jgi:Virulence factor BrkB
MGALALLYRFAPNWRTRSPRRSVSPGVVLATLLWLAGSAAFSFYAGRFGSYDRTYDPLGAAAVVLPNWLRNPGRRRTGCCDCTPRAGWGVRSANGRRRRKRLPPCRAVAEGFDRTRNRPRSPPLFTVYAAAGCAQVWRGRMRSRLLNVHRPGTLAVVRRWARAICLGERGRDGIGYRDWRLSQCTSQIFRLDHQSLAEKAVDGQAVGRHLLDANVRPTREVILIQPPGYRQKCNDPVTGLPLARSIDVDKTGPNRSGRTARS